MPATWLLAASPLLILGLPAVLLADRNLDYHRTNMREGKEYIWREKFRPSIGELIGHIERKADLSEKMNEQKQIFNSDDQLDPEDVDKIEDIPKNVLEDLPFTQEINEMMEDISKYSDKMTDLERRYRRLAVLHRRVGYLLIAAYVIWAYAILEMGVEPPSIPAEIYGIYALLGFYGSLVVSEYLDNKKELREYAEKYEENREI